MSMPQSEPVVRPNDTESRGSTAPLLPGSFPQSTDSSTPPPNESGVCDDVPSASEAPSKRPFWKLGKKVDGDKSKTKWKGQSLSSSASLPPVAATDALRPASPARSPEPSTGSISSQHGLSYGSPASPAQGIYSSSPRLHSPASSQIFERNVQEEVVPPQASPQIPSHIITENHIPPALDASSAAITDEQLNPDAVEIVTHSMHQPAAVPTTNTSLEASTTSLNEDTAHQRPEAAVDDAGSTYATLDSADVHRLSFISFADVVHAEHAEHVEHSDPGSSDLNTGRNSAHLGSLSGSAPGVATLPRSPSPIRSPLSSPVHGTSPPSSVAPSSKGLETSPVRVHRGSGSSTVPVAQSLLTSGGGELNIETMSQALRRTGSGDLSGVQGHPLSAVGTEDGTFADRPFKP